MNVTVYALLDPRDMRCRYVGKTKHGVQKRLRSHVSDARRRGGEIPRFRWINILDAQGLIPIVVVLERVDPKDWQAAEQMWVTEMRHRFPDLLNATDGGDGIHGHVHTEETKQRMSQKALEHYRDQLPDERAKSSAAIKAGMATPEARAKLRENARIKFADPEFRKGLAERSAVRARTPEARLRSSLLHKGKTVSDETRRKIGDANRGRAWTLEQKQAVSARRTGLKHSTATIEKMRAARTPEMKAASAERLREAAKHITPEQRQAISDRMKLLWQQRRSLKQAMQHA